MTWKANKNFSLIATICISLLVSLSFSGFTFASLVVEANNTGAIQGVEPSSYKKFDEVALTPEIVDIDKSFIADRYVSGAKSKNVLLGGFDFGVFVSFFWPLFFTWVVFALVISSLIGIRLYRESRLLDDTIFTNRKMRYL